MLNENFTTAAYMPTVIETEGGVTRTMDLPSRLLNDNIIFYSGGVDEAGAYSTVQQLLFLAKKIGKQPAKSDEEVKDHSKTIKMYINSGGGEIDSGMAIYDVMQHIKSAYKIPIETMALGKSMSMGSVLLAAGTKGRRSALPSARVMVHEPAGGVQGKTGSFDISNKEIQFMRHRMAKMYEVHTNMTFEQALEVMDHTDSFMYGEEAVDLGVIDAVGYPENLVDVATYQKEANQLHKQYKAQDLTPAALEHTANTTSKAANNNGPATKAP
jgi:ATP-dependent Clp protease protease subunit